MKRFFVEYTRELRDGRCRDITLETAFRANARELFETACAMRDVIWARYFQVGVEGDIAEYWRD